MRILKKQQIQLSDLNQMITKTNFISRQTKHHQAQQLLLKMNKNNHSQPTSLGSNATGTSTILGIYNVNQSNHGGTSFLGRIAADPNQSSVFSSTTIQQVNMIKQSSQIDQENSTVTSNRLIDNYFFHKKHFIEQKKQQFSENQPQIDGNQNIKPISNDFMDTILSDLKHNFPQVAKIPSKQRRLNNKSLSPNADKQSLNTPQQVNLQKYIDTEIFVPKILHEEYTLKGMVIDNKMRRSPVFESEKGDDWKKRIQIQIAKQRQFDKRIQKNIEQIELRLGLKKVTCIDTVTKLMNINATNSNIQLLQARVNASFNTNKTQSDQFDNDESFTIIPFEDQRGSSKFPQSVSPKIPYQPGGKPQINSNQDSVESLKYPIITQRSRQAAQGDFGIEQQQVAKSINYNGKDHQILHGRQIQNRLSSDLVQIEQPLSIFNDGTQSPFNISIPKITFLPSVQIGYDNRSSSLDQSIQYSKVNDGQTFDQSLNDNHSKNNFFSTDQKKIFKSQVRASSTIESKKGNTQRSSIKKILPSQKIKTVEGFFSPSKRQQELPSKVDHIKKLLIEILNEETKPIPSEQSQKTLPPNFYEMLLQTNNNNGEFPTIIDKTHIKKVMTLINRWYHFKEPFDNNIEPKLSVHQTLNPKIMNRHRKPSIKRQNVGQYLNLTNTLKRRAPSIEDSLFSEEDLSDNENEIALSDTEFASDEEDDLLFLNGDDDGEKMMVKIRAKINTKGQQARLQFLIKCLNMILLQKSDPFLAKKHREYLKMLRIKRKEDKEKTFYERMQEDIKKREKNTSTSPQLKNNNSSEWGLKLNYNKLRSNRTSSGHGTVILSPQIDQQTQSQMPYYSSKTIINFGFNNSNHQTPVSSSNNVVAAVFRKETQRIKPFQYSVVLEEDDEDNSTRKNRVSQNQIHKFEIDRDAYE